MSCYSYKENDVFSEKNVEEPLVIKKQNLLVIALRICM